MKQRWAHNLHTQNTYNLTVSDNTTPSRKRKSPRKNSSMQPDYYGTDGDQDSREIASGKASAKPPSNKRCRIGYKEAMTKRTPPVRKNSSESSLESLVYEEESESDDGDKGVSDRHKQ